VYLFRIFKIYVFLYIFVPFVFAGPLPNVPGGIPLEYGKRPATDLVVNGEMLTADEAHRLAISGADISLIDPDGTSNIWEDEHGELRTGEGLSDEIWRDGSADEDERDNLPVFENTRVKFFDYKFSRSGNFLFTGEVEDKSGVRRVFTFRVSKKNHNMFLRREFLRKIGYRIPPTKYVKKIVLEFPRESTKEIFYKKLSVATFGDPKRWVVSDEDGSNEIVLQDLIVTGSDYNMYNLATGFVPSHIIRGRRLFNALIVPFSLVEVPESVNIFSWRAGQIVSKHVLFSYNTISEFSCTFFDAKWIIKRILKLKRKDFEDIVRNSHFPEEVQLLLTEKLISRRNSLKDLFGIEADDIGVNTDISMGEFLKNGKLLKEKWEGHAARYAYGDPESPLSGSEIGALVKSKILTNVISNLISRFNSDVIPTVNIEENVLQHQMEVAEKNFAHYLRTGEVRETPFAVWAVPVASARLITSREIISGSYLGTDNIVQLADTVGFNVSAGAFLGTDGMPTNWYASGSVSAFFTRTYSHLKPIKSMKRAVNYPFKNILVPLLKRKFAHFFDDLVNGKLDSLEEIKRQEKISEMVGVFKENLEVGESIIISDSVGPEFQANVGYQFSEWLRAYANFRTNALILSRLHILRKDKDTIQIYKDSGNIESAGITFGLKAKIPVISISFKLSGGEAKTKFHSLNINEKEEENKDIVYMLSALRYLLLSNSLEMIDSLNKPYVLKHKFNEKQTAFKLMFWRWNSLKSKDSITIVNPQGDPEDLFRAVSAKRSGKNYQDFTTDVINTIIDEATDGDSDVSIVNNSSGIPGDTIYGKSLLRSIVFEGEVENLSDDRKTGFIDEPFVSINYVWKGWSIKNEKAQEILDSINDRFEREMYDKRVLKHTQKLLLYTINLRYFIYHSGIDHMVNFPSDEIEEIFDAFYMKEKPLFDEREHEEWKRDKALLVSSFKKNQKKYRKTKRKGLIKKYSKYALKMISIAEASLFTEGLVKLIGGEENIYAYSKMKGFRAGEETGDRAVISDSFGIYGDRYVTGPVEAIARKLKMTESEFYAYWIMGRL